MMKIILFAQRKRQYIFLLSMLIAVTTVSMTNKAFAATGIPIAVTSCACKSLVDLQAAASTYFYTWAFKTPPGYVGVINGDGYPAGQVGTPLLVVSSTGPISATFKYAYRTTHGGGYVTVARAATTNAQTITEDFFLARSAKTQEIKLPPGTTVNDTQEIISAFLSSVSGVPISGTPTYSVWHAFTNYPQLLQGTFTNAATGQTFTIWNGDVITVTDSNGWTAQFSWTPLSTVQWALVPNSIRDASGNPPGMSPVAPPSAALPGAAISVPYSGGPTLTLTPYTTPLPGGVITVGDPINSPGAPIGGCDSDGHNCH